MSPVMQEAIDKEDWERIDRGLPPRPVKQIVIEDPKPPEMGGREVKAEGIPTGKLNDFTATRRTASGPTGAKFIVFDVKFNLEGAKKGVTGWMWEGEFIKLRRSAGKRIEEKNITY